MKNRSGIVVAGYLGFENGGDEALLSVLVSETKRRLPDAGLTVLSARPEATRRAFGTGAVNRYDVRAVKKALSEARVFVFGGGSLLQDATSRRSLYYYLFLLRTAHRAGVRTMLLANGIGPLLRERSRNDVARALSDVDVITLRDGDSAELLCRAGVPEGMLKVTADPAFLIPCAHSRGGGGYAVVSARGGVRRAEALAELSQTLKANLGLDTLFLPMQFGRRSRNDDAALAKAAADLAGACASVWDRPFSSADAESIFGGAEITVGERLHALIFSVISGVPAVGAGADPKIESFCRASGMIYAAESEGAHLISAAARALSERDALSSRAASYSARAAYLAGENFDALESLYRA